MPDGILFCFASRAESRHLRRMRPRAEVLHTGIGARRARSALRACLARRRPGLIVSSGFAGGLNPALRPHDILYRRDGSHPLFEVPERREWIEGTFHSRDTLAATVEEKARLWRHRGRDAVEMESGPIREIAARAGIPCLVLRVISDGAAEALPLDFPRFMTPDWRVAPLRLAAYLLASPARVGVLYRFVRSIDRTALVLGTALRELLDEAGNGPLPRGRDDCIVSPG